MRWHRRLARWHVWLGWAISLPLILWCVTGLFMVARPIEEVRGVHLKRPPAPLRVSGPLRAPATGPRAVEALALEARPGGPVWVIGFADGSARRADPITGALLPPVSAGEAEAIARAAFAGSARLVDLGRTSAEAPPVELRKARPTWRARFADGTHLFVDADTGRVLATRTRLWRVYDFMWGLHIMAPCEREDTHHAVLIAAAAVSAIGMLLGTILLFFSRRGA